MVGDGYRMKSLYLKICSLYRHPVWLIMEENSKLYTYSVEHSKVVCCIRLSTYIFYFYYCISNTTGCCPVLKFSNSLDFIVDLTSGHDIYTNDIRLCPRVSKNVKGYRSHSVPFLWASRHWRSSFLTW